MTMTTDTIMLFTAVHSTYLCLYSRVTLTSFAPFTGASFGGRWGLRVPKDFRYQFFPVNCTLIKRETVLLLKKQYVTVGLAGQTMLFANIFNCIL